MLIFIVQVICIVMLFGVFIFAPGWFGIAAIAILLASLVFVVFAALKRQLQSYRQKPISRIKLAFNILFELAGILLAVVIAGLFGMYLAQIVTQGMQTDLIKVTIDLVLGLLSGIGIGLLVKRLWGRLISP